MLCLGGGGGCMVGCQEGYDVYTQLLPGSLSSYLDEGRGPAAITTTLPTTTTTITVSPLPRAVPPELPHVFADVDADLDPYRQTYMCMCN